jgi:phage shock protein PspC (stress-responsive transcriptional regulator)
MTEPMTEPRESVPLPTEQRWSRTPDDRLFTGTAGGLARAVAIEAVWVRLGFVVVGALSATGLVLYLAAWLGFAEHPRAAPRSDLRRLTAIVMAALSVIALLDDGLQWDVGAWTLVVVLAGVTVALWGRDGREILPVRGPRAADSTLPPPLPPPMSTLPTDGGVESERSRWHALRRRPRAPRQPSRLGWLVLGAAAIAGGVAWLAAEGRRDQGVITFGTAAAVIGAGLVMGTFFGRARWLVVPALACIGGSMAASTLAFSGTSVTQPTGSTWVEFGPSLRSEYDFGTGDVTVWLVNADRDVDLAVRQGAGTLRIVVPLPSTVELVGKAGAGRIRTAAADVLGAHETLRTTREFGDGGPTIRLDVAIGIGEIIIEAQSAAEPELDTPLLRSFNDGTALYADGSVLTPFGNILTLTDPVPETIVAQAPDGTVTLESGVVVRTDGTVITPEGFRIEGAVRFELCFSFGACSVENGPSTTIVDSSTSTPDGLDGADEEQS